MGSNNLKILFLALVASGCGTVVGNPKKPKDDPPASSIAFKLPKINLELPDGLVGDDASLQLTADSTTDDGDDGDRSVLKSWAKRFARMTHQVDAVSARVNNIIEKAGDRAVDGVLVFKKRGADHLTSGRLATLPTGGEYAYEAVLCHAGKVFSHLKWSANAERVELTRDFAANTDPADDNFALVTQIKMDRSAGIAIDFASQGVFPDTDVTVVDGPLLTEAAHVEQDANGDLKIRTVADNSEEAPADGVYDADRYLVGQVVTGSTEFAGYYKGNVKACKAGFDENASDIWQAVSPNPRFCIGRPPGAKKFASRAQRLETLNRLKPFGIESKSLLRAVAFEDGLSCN